MVDHLNKFGLLQPGVTVTVDDEHKVTLSGQMDSLEARKKLIATVANIEGIESVDDQIVVVVR